MAMNWLFFFIWNNSFYYKKRQASILFCSEFAIYLCYCQVIKVQWFSMRFDQFLQQLNIQCAFAMVFLIHSMLANSVANLGRCIFSF